MKFSKSHVAMGVVLSMVLTGCIAQFGGSKPIEQQTLDGLRDALRDQHELVETASWDMEGEGSTWGRLAGVLLGGTRSAGGAIGLFGGGEDDEPDTIAAWYLEQISKREERPSEFSDVAKDVANDANELHELNAIAERLIEFHIAAIELSGGELERSEKKAIKVDIRLLESAAEDVETHVSIFQAAAKNLSGEEMLEPGEKFLEAAGKLTVESEKLAAEIITLRNLVP